MGSVRRAGGRCVTAGLLAGGQPTLMETDPLNWSTRPAADVRADRRVRADGEGSGGGGFAIRAPAQSRRRPDAPRGRSGHARWRPTFRAAYRAVLGLMVAALVMFFGLAFRKLAQRLRDDAGWIQLGAAIGCCGLLVHSFVDFNLHIPANAAWFAVLASVATIAPTRRRQFPEVNRAEEGL